MRKETLSALAILLLTTLLTLTSVSVHAQPQALSASNIKVDHTLEIRNGGLLIVNDTVRLSTSPGETVQSLENFLIGFPFQFKYKLDYSFAYVSSNLEEPIEVVPDVGLGKIGFYGARVVFPQPVDISDGQSYDFTVVFVFSNLIDASVSELEPENAIFNASFPMFPSLTQSSSLCNVTVTLPRHAVYSGISHLRGRGLDFNQTELDTRTVLNYAQTPLESFADELGWLDFVQVAPGAAEYFLMFDVEEVDRDIRLDEWGDISVSDHYELTNLAMWNLTSITTRLPQGAYNIFSRDVRALGETNQVEPVETNNTRYVDAQIDLDPELKQGNTTELTVTYSLPWRDYVDHLTPEFEFTSDFLADYNFTVRKVTATITLPKGAHFRASSANLDVVERDALQTSVTFTFHNVTPFHDLSFDINYEHTVFWGSFYPTLWMGLLVTIIGSVILIRRGAPKPAEVPKILVSKETLRRFVDGYEEKTKISSEPEALEDLLRRGKITRRRYKIRRKTLEGRLASFSRELTNLRDEIRAAGAQYAHMMRQLEVAETLLDGVERDVRRVETQYRSGQISKGAYHRLIAEYEERRENALATIEGVLLRLREELH